MTRSTHAGVELAIDLVNSFAMDPTIRDPEYLRSPADLDQILRANGASWAKRLRADHVKAARILRGRLRSVFEEERVSLRLRTLNEMVEGARFGLGLEGDRLTGQLSAPTDDFAQWLSVEATLGLVVFVEEYGFERLGVCLASPCRDVYADASFNRSRRYCSDRCANRIHSAAHRRRGRLTASQHGSGALDVDQSAKLSTAGSIRH